jgi:tetratricopeptide (TPR) repeat protein
MVKPELVEYIKKEIKKGFSHDDIRSAMKDAGHAIEVIEEHLEHVKKEQQVLKKEVKADEQEIKKDEKDIEKLEEEIKLDERLLKYIKHELVAGNKEEHIKDKLQSVGHELAVVEHHLRHALHLRIRRQRLVRLSYIAFLALIAAAIISMLAHYTDTLEYHEWQGTRQFKAGDYEESIYHSKEALELGGDPHLQEQIGRAYLGLHNYPQALEHFEKALALQTTNSSLCGMGEAYLKMQDYPKSLVYLPKCILQEPDPAGRVLLYGKLTYSHTMMEGDEAGLWADRTRLLINLTKKYERAAVDDEYYGYALSYIGDHEEALAYLRKAKGEQPYIPHFMGRSLEALGDPGAVEMYLDSIRIDESFLPAYMELYRYHTERGNQAAALNIKSEALVQHPEAGWYFQ